MNAKDMKNMAAKAVLAAVMSLSLGAYAGSSWVTWYVAPDGDDANDGLSWATAMKSPELVPAKMIAADAGQTVQRHELIISNGYYRLSKSVRLNQDDGYQMGAIRIRSFTGNPADVTLDGQGQCQGVCLRGGWDGVISGLTVTNCVSTSMEGGGILMRSGTKGIVSNCIVRDCHVAVGDTLYNGGGIYGHSGTISGCVVEDCSITNIPAASAKGSCGGGIFGYRCMVTNCIVRNCSIRMNAGDAYPTGAGVWVGESSGSAYNDAYPPLGVFETEISGCIIEMPKIDAGRGTGLTVTCKIPDGADGTKYQATVKDCFVHDCTNHLDASVFLQQHVDAINVTSSNNYDACSAARSDNSTGLRIGPRCYATGCLIASNVGNTGDNNYGVPAVYMDGGAEGCSLVDSAVIGNESPAKVAIWFKSGTTSKMTVSNCVFSANRKTVANYGGLLWADELGEGCEVEIVDSYFTDNNMTNSNWGGWVRASTGTAGRQWAVRFRNCQCTGNKFGKTGAASAHTSGDANFNSNIELSFENCTIADNTYYTGYLVHGYSEGSGWSHGASSNVHIKACVFANNTYTGGWGQPIGGLIYQGTTNLNYSVFPQVTSWTLNPGMVGNRFYDSTKPLFVDAANGDYRLASRSQAINIAPHQPWMGNGTRNGPLDLGSGYKVQKSGKYGVTIVRENASRRFSGSLADAGCSEYFLVPGFSLFVR